MSVLGIFPEYWYFGTFIPNLALAIILLKIFLYLGSVAYPPLATLSANSFTVPENALYLLLFNRFT